MSKKSIFVIMPFKEELNDLWEIGIKETAENLGFSCFRSDGILNPGFIVDQIYDSIKNSDIIIGEMTGKNPNVFYEVGFAHALGKPTILLATSTEDLTAFDTRGLRHFLHNQKILAVRNFLRETLPVINISEIWPSIPGGNIIYEWPSNRFAAPSFSWWSKHDEKQEQVDEMGGQTIDTLESVGRIIRISNTDQNWNWYKGFSIMRLMDKINTFSIGDQVSLIIKAQTSGDITLKFIGDGGFLDQNDDKSWTDSWRTVTNKFENGATWSTFMLTATVDPTKPGYDPSSKGTTLLFGSAIGEKELKISRIQVVHRKSSR